MDNSTDQNFFLNVVVDRSFRTYIKTAFETLLLQKGITQQNLSDYLELNKSYISRVVHGLQIPPLKTRLAISEKLGVDSSLLWRVEHLSQIQEIIKKQKEIVEND